jgi:hypothetical protein
MKIDDAIPIYVKDDDSANTKPIEMILAEDFAYAEPLPETRIVDEGENLRIINRLPKNVERNEGIVEDGSGVVVMEMEARSENTDVYEQVLQALNTPAPPEYRVAVIGVNPFVSGVHSALTKMLKTHDVEGRVICYQKRHFDGLNYSGTPKEKAIALQNDMKSWQPDYIILVRNMEARDDAGTPLKKAQPEFIHGEIVNPFFRYRSQDKRLPVIGIVTANGEFDNFAAYRVLCDTTDKPAAIDQFRYPHDLDLLVLNIRSEVQRDYQRLLDRGAKEQEPEPQKL